MKKPTGRVEYKQDTSISYGGSGRNPPRSWQVIVDGAGRVNSDTTYAWAAIHLANDLAWRDPRVIRLRAEAEAIEKLLIREHMVRLTAERPDQDNTDPDLGRKRIYEGADMTCGVCYTHEDHKELEIAHMHGCNR